MRVRCGRLVSVIGVDIMCTRPIDTSKGNELLRFFTTSHLRTARSVFYRRTKARIVADALGSPDFG